MKTLFFTFTSLLILGCNNVENGKNTNPEIPVPSTPVINVATISQFPHDTNSYTEGLLVHDGQLFESTGYTDELPQTRSLFGVVDFKTGKIATKVELDKKKYFGEGIVFLNNKVYQLTYKTKIGFIYDSKTFKQIGTFTYPSAEGWGMTTDSLNIIMSDGTSKLTYLEPTTMKVVKQLTVLDEGKEVVNINELEFIKGFIYANKYTTNTIIKIDPLTGKVVGKLDLTTLANQVKSTYNGSLEMNGIAYDAIKDKVYITGKMWPSIYEIRFTH